MSPTRDNLIRDKHNVGEGLMYIAAHVHGRTYCEYAKREIPSIRCVSGLRAYWGHLSKTKRYGEHWQGDQRRKARRLFGGGMPDGYACTDCGAQGVKLWRPSHSTKPLLCESCGTKSEIAKGRRERSIRERRGDQLGYLLPAIPDEDGSMWGYTSVPEPFCIWWYRLPTVQS